MSKLIPALILMLINTAVVADGPAVTELMTQQLQDLDDKIGQVITVEYGPGMSSATHRHNAHIFLYVLEGSVLMQVEGGELKALGPGDTFYESPDDVHTVSRNASHTLPAKFLVFMLKDKGRPTAVPAPEL